jgi:hypothetical protein
VLAKDRFLPRQFNFKGDRLAYSNGMFLLAVTSAVLLAAFGGDVTRLIPLYALGVFVSFTLSQSGMMRHWWRERGKGWVASLGVNTLGATVTGGVAVILVGAKFVDGAWITIILIASLIPLFWLIRKHYDGFETKLQMSRGPILSQPPRPSEGLEVGEHIVVPVDGVNRVSTGAVTYAKSLSDKVTAAYVTDDAKQAEEFRTQWEAAMSDVPLMVIESPYRALVVPVLAYIESLEAADPNSTVTVVLPKFVTTHWWERFLHNQDILRLKSYIGRRSKETNVVEFPYRLDDELAVSP